MTQYFTNDFDLLDLARSLFDAIPREDSEQRAFCPTGDGGGIKNDCGDDGAGTTAVEGSVTVNEDWKTTSGQISFNPVKDSEAPSDGFAEAGKVTILNGAKLNESLENIGVDLGEAASVMVAKSDDFYGVHVIMDTGASDPLVSGNTVTAMCDARDFSTTATLLRVPESGDPTGVEDGWNRTPGELVLTYHLLAVPPEAQESSPTAVGRQMLSGVMNSIRNAKKIGVDEIEMIATGSHDSEEFKGYRIWPRLGFDGAIPESIYHEPSVPLTDEMLTPQAIKARDSGTLTVQQLYGTREGQRWWESNGSSMPMTLRPGSTRSAGWKRFKALSDRFSSRSLDMAMAFGDWGTPECRALLESSWVEFRGCGRDSDGKFGSGNDCAAGDDLGGDNPLDMKQHSESSSSGGGGREWGISSETEMYNEGRELFDGSSNLGPIRVNHPQTVRETCESNGISIGDVVQASGAVVDSASRAGMTPPSLIINPVKVSLQNDLPAISVMWSCRGTSDGSGYTESERQEFARVGSRVEAASVRRVITPTSRGFEVYLDNFFLHPDFQGKGIALESVMRTVSTGPVSMTMLAGRDDSPNPASRMNGYRQWLKYGYNTSMDSLVADLAYEHIKVPPEFQSAPTLRDLVRMPGGAEWWKSKGTSVDLSFDTSEGSDDLQVLYDYARDSAEKHREARSILDIDEPESLDIAGDSDSDPAVDDGFWERFNERQIARQNGEKKDVD